MATRWLRIGVASVLGVVLALSASVGFAQRSEAQKHLAAERAARMDAMRKLVEQLKGMEIRSGTTVVDFALLEDVIKGRTEDVVRGCRESAPAKHYADGTCELTLEVTVAQVTENLKQVIKGHYHGDRFHGTELEELSIKTEKTVMQATGSGSDVDLTAPETPAAGPGGGETTLHEPPMAGVWARIPGRERLKAQRAAEMDGKRKLVERVFGTQIMANTTVRDFALESDEIRGRCEAFIQGASVQGYRYLPDGIVECRVVMPVEEVVVNLQRILQGHYHGDRFHGTDFEQIKVTIGTKDFEEVGKGAVGINPEPESEVKVKVDIEKKEIIPPGGKEEKGVTIEKKTVVE